MIGIEVVHVVQMAVLSLGLGGLRIVLILRKAHQTTTDTTRRGKGFLKQSSLGMCELYPSPRENEWNIVD